MADVKHTAVRLVRMLSPSQRRSALWLLLMMIVGMGMEMLGIGLLLPTLAILTDPDARARYAMLESLAADWGSDGLILGAMLVLSAVYAAKTLFLAFVTWRKARFAYHVQAALSERLFTAYLRQPWTFHLQRNSAQLVRNAYGETTMVTVHGLIPAMMLVSELLVFVGIAALLLWVEPVGALLVVVVLGAAAGAFNRFTRGRITRWGAARQHHDGKRMQHLQQGLGGVKDVKLLGREAEFLRAFRTHNAASSRVSSRWQAMQDLPRLVLELIGVLGMTALVAVLVARGRPIAALIPTLGLFAAAAFKLMPSVNRILSAYQKIRYVERVVDTLSNELPLEAEAEHEKVASRVARMPFRDRLALQNVGFCYPGTADPLFRSLSLSVPAGSTVGIVGESGGGKTTLVDLMLGLLDPDSGSVTVDGRDIRTNLRGWQDEIGYVPQFIYLTDDTIRRNVAFGLAEDEIDDDAVRHAIHAAQLDGFVAELADGLETIVGERGVRLSGGQRQRIGIARALYHDPAVLVLDEATSSLDTTTEEGVMDAVRALRREKTIVIVAHRLTTVAYCDRVYKLEGGRLHEADGFRTRSAEVAETGPSRSSAP